MEWGHVLELNEIYYGTKCTERTHRLSLALCKRAKESGEVVWLTEVRVKTLQARSFLSLWTTSFRMLLFTSPHRVGLVDVVANPASLAFALTNPFPNYERPYYLTAVHTLVHTRPPSRPLHPPRSTPLPQGGDRGATGLARIPGRRD